MSQSEISASFKKPKSASLTKDELRLLKQYRKGFKTEVECAVSIGIDRNVLNRIIIIGSGSPDNVKKIRTKLKAAQSTN